jgi:hypothetical protein
MQPIPSNMNLGANIFHTIRCLLWTAAESIAANTIKHKGVWVCARVQVRNQHKKRQECQERILHQFRIGIEWEMSSGRGMRARRVAGRSVGCEVSESASSSSAMVPSPTFHIKSDVNYDQPQTVTNSIQLHTNKLGWSAVTFWCRSRKWWCPAVAKAVKFWLHPSLFVCSCMLFVTVCGWS